MKKITYLIILFILSITLVNAKSCTIVSGTGKNIGDEIACGTEHFYVVSNDGKNVKMLGKYNLLVGSNYDSLTLTEHEYTNFEHIYKNQEVIDRINSTGILLELWSGDYEYDDTIQKYRIYSIFGATNLGRKYQVLKLDGANKTHKEIINNSEIKKLLEQGWNIEDMHYDKQTTIDSEVHYDYYAVTLYKDENIDCKTIFLDGTSRTLNELLNIPEIKKLLDDGYLLSDRYYSNSKTQNNEYYRTYYAVTLNKKKNIDVINIIFEEKIVGYNNMNNYINNDEYIQQKIAEGYSYEVYKFNESIHTTSPSTYNFYGVMLTKENYIYSQTLQDEKAIGINGDVEGPNYPFYGVVYRNNELNVLSENKEESYGGGYYHDFDISTHTYFKNYKKTLEEMGYNITKVSTLSLKELNEMTINLIGKEIPLEEWYEAVEFPSEEWYSTHVILGNLNELYDGQHNWIWSTSYWLKTSDGEEDWSERDLYNLNTMGDLCLTNHCAKTASRGFRPLVTIAAEDIIYDVQTKTDGNGTVTAIEKSKSGEEITFTVKPKIGYTLKEVKVTDADGNVIVFKNNTFTMPTSNVLIEATFEVKNPNTIAISVIACFIFTIVSFVIYKKHNNKINWLNN